MQDKWQELRRRLAQVQNIRYASAVLGWDQQTYMPPKGAAGRAEQLGTLDKIAHEMFTSDEIGRLLEDLTPAAAKLDFDSDDASLIRVTKRDYEKACRVPPELVEEISRTSALGIEAWAKAREESNFKIFQPLFERIVDLEIQLAEHLGYQERVYDALLDQYEPGMKSRQVQEIFDDLKKELMPLVRAIGEKSHRVDDACLHREFDPQKQWDFGVQVIKAYGFDFDSGRQDKSAHPFTTGFGLGDVRITTRMDPHFLPMALFGTLHECGHALYDQGYRPELEGTPLAGGASLGVHESQSRMWENLVGRSLGFWKYWFMGLRSVFPRQLADYDAESFYRAVNKVEPSLIRVEADEVTYNLHIMLRFELENVLVEKKLKVSDVPEAWAAKMKEYFDLVPPSDAVGSLQDIHWSLASLGYFPTYSLGNLLSVQLFDQAVRAVPDIPSQIENGKFSGLLGWLRENLHQHGRKFTLEELAVRITGKPLEAKSYVAYLKTKYGEIYGL